MFTDRSQPARKLTLRAACVADSPEARSIPDEVYRRIALLLRDARRIESPGALEARVRAIETLIQSEGPVSDAFLPSLEELHERVTEANL